MMGVVVMGMSITHRRAHTQVRAPPTSGKWRFSRLTYPW
jgi:hypothetical protein